MLLIDKAHQQKMIDHVEACLPEEACGLIIGKTGYATEVIPITNQLRSTVRFMMEPLELLRALQYIEAKNLDLIAAFHSHPKGPPHPSATDIAEFYYPGILTIILTPQDKTWQMNVFEIQNGSYLNVDWIFK